METNEQDLIDDEFIEVPETYTTVDLGVLSGFKFGIGFALGALVVSLLSFLSFGALLAGFLRELMRSTL